MPRSILIALAALAAGTAAAQENRRPDPTDARAKVPGVEYRSAYTGYRPFTQDKVAPWRESNDAAKSGAGREGHAAQKPAPGKPPVRPSPGAEHGGHR